MQPRQQKILTVVVKEYIRSADPVSSGMICRRYRVAASPATVRNELADLTDEGYLRQPHTSSGRVPTNKAYRFFVNEVIADSALQESEKVQVLQPDSFEGAVDWLSHRLQAFSLAALEDGRMGWGGLDELLAQPEFNTHEEIKRLGYAIERMRENLEDLFLEFENAQPTIFVGEEAPILEHPELSVLVSPFETSQRHRGVFLSVGPTRMPYERNWQVLQNVRQLFSQL
jgi:heat-inducible transcriptional repressor